MENENMKNMIILKDLPSNLVEEAIVIFKTNKKIKKPELIENKKHKFSNNKDEVKGKKDDFLVKEAQNVISDYIYRIENQDLKGEKSIKKLEEKYKKLKLISGILTLRLWCLPVDNYILNCNFTDCLNAVNYSQLIW